MRLLTIRKARARSAARRQLERALGVDRRERRLLTRLARVISEQDHTCLLIGRGCFEAAIAKADLGHEDLVQVERLRARVYGISRSKQAR